MKDRNFTIQLIVSLRTYIYFYPHRWIKKCHPLQNNGMTKKMEIILDFKTEQKT